MKTILVTGAAGFIGSYLVKRLCESSAENVVIEEDGGTLSYENETHPLSRGEKYFICADTEFTLTDATAVLCYPPKHS